MRKTTTKQAETAETVETAKTVETAETVATGKRSRRKPRMWTDFGIRTELGG